MVVLDERMIGNEFGWLTVIELADSKNGRKRYRCKCRCGKEVIKIGTYLRKGNTTSCGCARSKNFLGVNSRRYKDLTGMSFGKLTVIRVVNFEGGHARFLCKCECGNTKVIRSPDLQSGQTKSCGCLQFSLEGSVGPLLEHIEKSLSVEKNTSVYRLIQKGRSNSGVKGVSFERKRGKWKAHLTFKGKNIKKDLILKKKLLNIGRNLKKSYFYLLLKRLVKWGC